MTENAPTIPSEQPTTKVPKFKVLAGIGGLLAYLLGSIPLIIAAFVTITISNPDSSPEELNNIYKDTINNSWFLVGILITQCAAFVIYALVVLKIRGSGNFRNDLGLRFSKSALWFILVGFGLQIIGIIITIPISSLRDKPSEQDVVTSFKESSGWAILVLALLIAFVVPAVEEMCFRGLFQRGLLRKVSPLTATLISGCIFAGVHFADPNAILGGASLLTVGLFAAALTTYRGKIDASICLHIGFNLTTVMLLVASR